MKKVVGIICSVIMFCIPVLVLGTIFTAKAFAFLLKMETILTSTYAVIGTFYILSGILGIFLQRNEIKSA